MTLRNLWRGRFQSAALLLAVLLVGSALPAMAQLTGGNVYPINGVSNAPTSFATMTEAVTYITTNGVNGTGQVVLELSSGYVAEPGPLTIPVITGTSATLGVTFRPASGYTALTSTAGGSSPNQFAIQIRGNYLTLDGRGGGTGSNRDWTIRCTGSGSSGNGQSAVRIDNGSNTMTDDAIRYCILEAEAANTTSGIVGMTGGATNTVKNLIIANNLIRSTGVSSTTSRGIGVQVATISNVGNTGLQIVDNVINDCYQNGIRFTGGFPGAVIARNNIFMTAAVTQNSTVEYAAIYYSTTSSAGTIISHNFVHDIQLTNGTTAANGIYLFNGATSGARNKVYNNRVQIGAGIAPTTFPIWGIRDNSVSSAVFDVDYNSVYIGGTATGGSSNSAAYRKEVNSALNLRDNIFFNARSNSGGTGTHWGISINATTSIIVINNNDYFANGTGGVLGTTDGATSGNKTTIAAWKAAVTADTNSFSSNPNFINPTSNPPDLHVNTGIASRVESGGLAITGIDDDFEGNVRFGSGGYAGAGTAPDVGADEFEGTPALANDVRALAFVDPTNGGTKSAGINFSPQASFENLGTANQSNVPVRYRIFGPSPSNTEVYNQTGTITTLNSGANSTVTFAAANLAVAGTYTMKATSELAGDQNTANDEITGTFDVLAPLSGTYNVGSGNTAPFDKLTTAIARLVAVGASSNVTFNLTDASYTSGTETFPLTIAPYAGAGPSAKFTIKPNSAGTTITGSSSTAIFVLDNADYVTIDGSSTGALLARDLTITNSSSSASTAVVWLKSNGVGQGATNNTVKNCVLVGGADQTTSSNETFAIIATGSTISTSTGGNDNDTNTFTGNDIKKVRNGIYLLGVTGNTNDNNTVSQNVVGPSAFGTDQIGRTGIIARFQNVVTISQNEVRFVGEVVANGASATDRVGIGVGGDNWVPTSSTVTSSVITRNLVHDIVDEKTFSSVGILVAGSGSPSSNIVANNMLYNVRANGTSGDQGVGIGISDGNGDIVAFNSILMTGDIDPGASTTATQSQAGIRIASTTPTNLVLKNNSISVDNSSNTGTLRHYAIVAPSTSYAWGTGAADANDYYTNSGNAQMVLGGIGTSVPYTNVTTLTSWQTQFTPNQDANSFVASPPYVSSTDLHLLTNVPTPLESGGFTIGAVPRDYDNDVRGLTPDVGADEGNFLALPNRDIAAVAFIDPTNGGTKAAGVAFSPQASFENRGGQNQTNVPVRYRILGPAPGNTEIYNQTFSIPTLTSGAGPTTVTFASTTINVGGTYTIIAKSELLADQNIGNDQITGSFEVQAPLNGVYNVGTGETAPFDKLTTAIARLNSVGVSGAVTFNLTNSSYTTPSETFPLAITAFPGASASNTVTIKPANPGTSISASSTTSILTLDNADYVIVDGSSNGTSSRDLSISNTSTAAATAAIWLKSGGAGLGATHDVIKNVNIAAGADQSTSTNETFAVISTGSTISISTGGADNDLNTFQNNLVTKARHGIYLVGVTGNPNDSNTVTQNVVGPSAFGADQIGRCGIVFKFQNLGTISANEVRFVGNLFAQASSGSDRLAIGLGGDSWTPSSTTTTNCSVVRNLIHDIVEEKTFSCVGIVVGGSGSPSSNVIANNMIYGVRANGTFGDQAVGIGIADGNGDTVAYNSISMTGDSDPGSSDTSTQSTVGIRVASTTPTNLTLKNNIISVDVTSNTSSLKHYAIVAPATSYAWGTGAANNNDYYTNGANTQMVLGGIGTTVPYTNVTTLASWKTQFTPNQDAASLAVIAPFVSSSDLHLQTNVPTFLESGGTPLAAVTVDYDNQARNGSTPDIGADEGNFTAVSANDVKATAFIDPVNAGAKIAGVSFQPQASFENVGSANQSNVPVRYRISGPAPDTTTVYNDVSSIVSLPAGGAPVTVTFGSITLNTGGVYTMRARAELVGDQDPANDQITGTFEVLAPLAGAYDVGAAQAAPFNTLTGAVNRLNQVGASDHVVFRLVDATYTTPAETFPITVNSYPGAGPTRTFKVIPANNALLAPVNITGLSTSAVIVLNGADYVTLDGSANGTSSRDLTLTNTSTSSSSAVVWGQTTAGSDPATHNVIKNLNLQGNSNTTTLIGVGLGGTTISITSNGTGNNDNRIQNNNVFKTQYGIYTAGASAANKNTGTVITQNLVNTVSPNNVTIGGIFVRFEDGVQITNNSVGDIIRASGSNFGISLGLPALTNLLTSVTTGDDCTNGVVTGNRVTTIDSPSSTGFSAVGVVVGRLTSGTTLLANNMVSGVTSPATPDDFTAGIYLLGGAGSTTNVYFNSVSLTGNRGSGATNPSVAFAIGGANPVVDVQNNIFSNTQTTASTGKSYAVGLAYSTYTNLLSNHNDLYVSGASGVLAVVGGMTNTPAGDRSTLAAWQTETGQDLNSISANALFAGTNDLHIDVSGVTVSPVANAGVSVGGIVVDFDGDARTATPDLGADEFQSYTLTTVVDGNGSVAKNPNQPLYNPGASVQLTATADPDYIFENWSGDATGSQNPLNVIMNANKTITAHFDYGLGIAVNDSLVAEGSGFSSMQFIVSVVSLVRADTIRVHWATADSTATVANGDYFAASGNLVFPPGVTADTISVTVNGDLTWEQDEVFKLVLSNNENAQMLDPLGIGTIQNDDPLPTIIVNDVTVIEGTGGMTQMKFTVELSRLSSVPVSVTIATADSTALAGSDYTALSPTVLTWTTNDLHLDRLITVDVNPDSDVETIEHYLFTFSNVANASLPRPRGLGIIADDDGVITGAEEAIPAFTFMAKSYPNPFTERVALSYGLKEAGPVSLQVYDVQGRLVREVLNRSEAAGYKLAQWDGRDDAGHEVGSGLYFVRLQTKQKTFKQSIVIQR